MRRYDRSGAAVAILSLTSGCAALYDARREANTAAVSKAFDAAAPGQYFDGLRDSYRVAGSKLDASVLSLRKAERDSVVINAVSPAEIPDVIIDAETYGHIHGIRPEWDEMERPAVFGLTARSLVAQAEGRITDALAHAHAATELADATGGAALHRHPRIWLANALTSLDRFEEGVFGAIASHALPKLLVITVLIW